MYNTRLRNDTRRYIAKCIVNNIGPKVVEFVVDTRAKYTCCSYLSIDSKLKENGFKKAEFKLLGGIISGDAIKVYKYRVTQFTIGTIDLGARDIWITFDERVSDDVLGMDLLSTVFFMQDANECILYFDENGEHISVLK